ncbi:ABC transporter substrate-binding protein, partial [bacterium]|nr:ABC transporter substrate-binding protein [bacterium]
MKSKIFKLSAALVTAVSFAVPVSSYAVDDIRVGLLNPLSGSNVDAGQQDLTAAELAVADINAAGGIKALGGAKLKLVPVDTTSDPKNAASTAERAFSTEKIVGAVGTGISAL